MEGLVAAFYAHKQPT